MILDPRAEHHLLLQHGYPVLDMDYRASEGYGRDWRDAIYRNMGHPELEDLLDGKAWLVQNWNIDPKRIGLYGGSYGGVMPLMAFFHTPEERAAGPAGMLRILGPGATIERGYSITRDAQGNVISQVAEAKTRTRIKTRVRDGEFESTID